MSPDYKSDFLSGFIKTIIGLYQLENGRSLYGIRNLNADKLKDIYDNLSKESREIMFLPAKMLFSDNKALDDAIAYTKFRYISNHNTYLRGGERHE